jgi:hypothetical protein
VVLVAEVPTVVKAFTAAAVGSTVEAGLVAEVTAGKLNLI